MPRLLRQRPDGSYWIELTDGTPLVPVQRLVLRSDGSHDFLPVTWEESKPWSFDYHWAKPDRDTRTWAYRGGMFVECHCPHNTLWLGVIQPDPQGKDYIGSDCARVILDGNTVSENAYKAGLRPLSILEALAWSSL